jgi:hypothetical protein
MLDGRVAPENVDLSDPEVLSGLSFESIDEANQKLTAWANRLGFDLSLSTSRKWSYARLHCAVHGSKRVVRGGEGQRGPCPCYYRLKPNGPRIVVSKNCPVHNHPLDPMLFAHRILDSQIIKMIRDMSDSNIEPVKIGQWLQTQGINITGAQIYSLCRPGRIHKFESQASDLIKWVRDRGGVFHVFTDQICETETVVAVLVIMPSQMEALCTYADLIEIDGTHPQLSLRWEVIPITLMDSGRHIICGGICFAAYFTTEVVFWLLKILWSYDRVAAIWRVLLTDEDAAFIPAISLLRAIPGFPVDFEHRICGMHKKKNFSEKVFSCGFSPEQRKTINALFKVIAYSDNIRAVDNGLNEIARLNNASLNAYMEKNILPNLVKFSRAYLGPQFACGLTTTSAAESMNHMLKSGMGRRRLTLQEAFQRFTNRLRFHDQELLLARVRYHRNEKVFACVGLDLAPAVNARILHQTKHISTCRIGRQR